MILQPVHSTRRGGGGVPLFGGSPADPSRRQDAPGWPARYPCGGRRIGHARRRGRDGLKLIYTIGYQRLTSRRLEKIVGDLDAILVDCRYRPFSQRPEFSGDRLAEQFGARCQQRGHELGGHGHTTVDGIDRLRLDAERATLLLLCMEEAPGDCHRHHAICGPHFPAAVHIFRDEQFTAKTLQDALDAGDVARLYGETADLFR